MRPTRWSSRRLAVSVSVALAAAALAGCGGERLYPIRGTLAWQDGAKATQLANGVVVFQSLTDPAAPGAQGQIEADGSFRMTTAKPGDGVRPGKYRVMVMPPPPIDEDRPTPPASHPRYKTPATSDLEVEIEAKENVFTLTLERNPKAAGKKP